MACLFSTSPNLAALGPHIAVKISPSSALRKALKPEEAKQYDKQFSAVMLIDTGASSSMIDIAVAPFLGLSHHGTAAIVTPSGAKDNCLTFDIDLVFEDHKISVQNLKVIEGDFKNRQGIDGLIGRDVLSNALLVYQGWANQYTIAF